MRSIKYHIIVAAFFIIMPAVLNSQEVMTLSSCMKYAVENAPKAKKQAAENCILKEDYLSAIMQFLPSVYGSVGTSSSFGRSIDPETNTYANYTNFSNSYSLSASYNIFDGFSTVNNYKIAKNAKALGVITTQQVEDEICLEVIQAYYNLLYYSEMSKLAEAQLNEAQRNYKMTKKQQEQGLKSYADVAETEASVAEQEYNLINMQNKNDNALAVLKQVMYYPISKTLVIDNNIPIQLDAIITIADVDKFVETAKNSLPSILSAKNDILTAEYNYKTAKWGLLPSLNANAGYSTGYIQAFGAESARDPFWQQMKDLQGEYVSLSLRIPIFSQLSQQSTIRKNKQQLRIAEYEYDDKVKAVEVDIELAVQDMNNAMKSFAQADKRYDAQNIAYGLNLKRYEQGLISAIELQTSTNTMLSAAAERLNAFFQYKIKNKVVQYYQGIPYIEQN
jgi:outer membrane protein